MLDSWLRPYIDPPLAALAAPLVRMGIRADGVTWAGFGIGLAAVAAIALGQYMLGLGLIALNRLADGLDGAIARQTQRTDYGGYLDIVLDFVFYAAVPLGFALANPADALAAGFLLASFFAAGGSFLAYAIIAGQRGLSSEAQGKKSFFYMAGLFEGTETIVLFIICCLWPAGFTWLALGAGCLCYLTAIGRIRLAWQNFR